MKCPKCGYNSFDHLDNCKKCNIDLTEHKARFGIKSVLLAEALQDGLSAESLAVTADEPLVAAPALDDLDEDFELPETAEGEDFGFDFMGDGEEEEDLAFDELFEDVPADEKTEETLPAPNEPRARDDADFSFDEADPLDVAATGSDPDFDFGEADPDADIFAETEDFLLDEVEPEPKKG
jgi:hypothetical protein